MEGHQDSKIPGNGVDGAIRGERVEDKTIDASPRLTLQQRELLESIEAMKRELTEIKSTRVWRLMKFLWGFQPYLKFREMFLTDRKHRQSLVGENFCALRATGESSGLSKGTEVWLLGILDFDLNHLPWTYIKSHTGFSWKTDESGFKSKCLVSSAPGASIILPRENLSRIMVMSHPWSGIMEFATDADVFRLDLYSTTAEILQVDINERNIKSGDGTWPLHGNRLESPPHIGEIRARQFSVEEKQWLDAASKTKPDTVAVFHPKWFGIRSSSKQHFETCLEIDDTLDIVRATKYAQLLASSGCSRIVFNGFPLTYRYLVRALRSRFQEIDLFATWHGNFMQAREDYSWQSLQLVLDFAKDGAITRVGFAKDGMAEIMANSLGIETAFVPNYVRKIPEASSEPLAGGPHIGLWSLWGDNWQKPPYSMLIASYLVEEAVIHCSGANPRIEEFIRRYGIRAEWSQEPILQENMPQKLSQMHVNLNVSLTECAPMIVLESLSEGSPCLLGPGSHYFEDHPYLRERLVVPTPDRPESIADHIVHVLGEREEIIQAYREYAGEYNKRAAAMTEAFLS